MAKHKLKVGYIGTSISSYYGGEYNQRPRAIAGLEKLAEELDFQLIAVHEEAMTEEGSVRAAQYFKDNEIDFLLLQAAACSMGEQLLPLVKAAPRMGIWATPDPEQEGEIKIHSVVTMSHFSSIIKRYLKHENIPFKWFYGHVETEEFQSRFSVTVRALTAVKNMERSRIGWIGNLSPGFNDMIFDERLLRNRMGISVLPHELAELVQRAKGYDPEPVSATVNEIKSVAREITVTEDSAFDRVTRVYLAMRDMAKDYNYDALAVQCWPNFQSYFKVALCMAYGWLGSEDGIAVSCEGDVLGAASMHLLNVLTGKKGSSTLLDMTALDPETNAMLM